MAYSVQFLSRVASSQKPSSHTQSMRLCVNARKPGPNRNVTEACPSLHGHISWTCKPSTSTPPAWRVGGVAPSGVDSAYDWQAWFMLCWADMSTCWPRPETVWRSHRAISAAPAASEAALWNACGNRPPVRTGARSESPVIAMFTADACNVRSETAQSALGPSEPNGEIDTYTSSGLISESVP